jgi:hypothetical protein
MLSKQTKEYLQTPSSGRRAVLKKHYLSNPFGTSERQQTLDHLGYLIEFTRRLNMVECKHSNQPMPKPSAIRETDMFVCVEVCAESIRENTFLKSDAEFWRCWTAFDDLLKHVRSNDNSESFFETAYLLFYLTALILKRHVTDGTIEKEPQIFSIKEYATVAARLARPLFESVKCAADQMQNLAENLECLAQA